MICNGRDTRNISLVADLLQMKLLVALLRKIATFPNCRYLLVDAAADVNQDGFSLMGDDTLAAVTSFTSVVGFQTDLVVDTSKMSPEAVQAKSAALGVEVPEFETTPKDQVN